MACNYMGERIQNSCTVAVEASSIARCNWNPVVKKVTRHSRSVLVLFTNFLPCSLQVIYTTWGLKTF